MFDPWLQQTGCWEDSNLAIFQLSSIWCCPVPGYSAAECWPDVSLIHRLNLEQLNLEWLNLERLNPEWTEPRMDCTSNGKNPEWTEPPNGLNSEWTDLRMDSAPNGLNPEWTQPRPGLNPEKTELRKGLSFKFLSTSNGTISRCISKEWI
jgi:hypothetical protein